MNKVTMHSSVAELLLQWPELRPILAEAGLTGLRHADHWPAPAVTIEFAAQRHRLDAEKLLAVVTQAIGGKPPVQRITKADLDQIAAHQHDCHCGE
jgi:hypothetical protein